MEYHPMMERKITKEENDEIVSFLEKLDFFSKLNRSFLKELVNSMSILTLEGGETLIIQGELNKSMYVVYQGRMRIYKSQKTAKGIQNDPIADVPVGDMIGAISLLSDEPRFFTVISVRDSIVLKLSEEVYHKIERYYPQEALLFAKIAIKRLISQSKPTVLEEKCTSIAVAPAGDSNHKDFIHILFHELNKMKPTILVNKEICNSHFGSNIAQSRAEEYSSPQITRWLHSLESEYGYIIYETDRQMTPWTQRCFRQADRILLVAEESIYPALNSIEINLFSDKGRYLPSTDLVFIHPENTITGTSQWLKNRPVNKYHHLVQNSDKDLAKLIRFINGTAIGLVLSGGGARGLAHIGAIKAMEELNIPIDFIAGNSTGAMISGYVAQGLSFDELRSRTRNLIKIFRREYTFPLVSLMTGKSMTKVAQKIGNDYLIEDLPTRFICVSSNITEASLRVHDKGPLWFAIRSSISIPGIYPPIYDDDGNMLVDGGIINNMPVDQLRKYMGSGKILAINCHPYVGEHNRKLIKDPYISGWKLLLKRLIPFYPRAKEPDNILDIILSALQVSAFSYEKQMEAQADYLLQFDTSNYNLLEFDHLDEFIELGYRHTMTHLPRLLNLVPGETKE